MKANYAGTLQQYGQGRQGVSGAEGDSVFLPYFPFIARHTAGFLWLDTSK